MRKSCSSDREKLLKFENEGREFAKKIEFTRTIYSNSAVKGLNYFWLQNAFLTCSLRFLIGNKLQQLEFILEKIIGI